MKKLIKHPKGVRLEAIVEKDGIGFIPTKIAGPASLSFTGSFVKLEEENGEITSMPINIDQENDDEMCAKSKMDETIHKKGFRVLLFAASAIIASLAMMFVSAIWLKDVVLVNAFAGVLYLMTFLILLPKAWAILLGRIFRKKDMISFSKHLAAKNAVENAYYDLGRVPNMEEAKKYSTYSAEDKYTKNSYLAALWTMVICAKFLNGWAYWLLTICAILVICWLDWKNYLCFIQALVVSKPKEDHYKVAIAALEEVADVLDHVEIQFHTIEIAPDPENFDEEKCSKKGCPAFDLCKEESQRFAKNKDNDKTSK